MVEERGTAGGKKPSGKRRITRAEAKRRREEKLAVDYTGVDHGPMLTRPRLKLVLDQASANLSMIFALLFFFGLRLVPGFDIFHRISNDLLDGARAAGMGELLLL